MKYTLYRFRRIQGAWINRGELTYAANKREARQTPAPVGYAEDADRLNVWLLSGSAPEQVGCGPCGTFPLKPPSK